MLISEIFYSIQGESLLAGLPTVFVRTYGCNMRCWWCDSRYAVEGGTLGKDYRSMDVHNVDQEIMSFGDDIKYVCLTGGEPTLQKDLPDLIELLLARDIEISIETDGGVDLTPFLSYGVHLIMDVKLADSGMRDKMFMLNLENLRPLFDQVKFVIASRQDYAEALETIQRYKLIEKGFIVLFSAVHAEPTIWSSNESISTNNGLSHQDLAEWILNDRLPVRMQVQMHKVIWPGKTRGI